MANSVRWLGWGAGLAAAAYGTFAGITWCRYGRSAKPASSKEADALLDRFMPAYEVVERHHIRVRAPAEITLAAACDMDLEQSRVVRAIFRTRELILGSKPQEHAPPRGLLKQVTALGWGVLAEAPGREIVFGAVTQPWAKDIVFRAVRPCEFAGFHEPGYVKIVFTLRADPTGDGDSVFHTETRVMTTDPEARAKFRLYWSFFSPGIILIRLMTLGPLKAEAERRARAAPPVAPAVFAAGEPA